MKLYFHTLIVVFIMLLTCLSDAQSQLVTTNVYAEKSHLSEGKWLKFNVPETGIYKITYSTLKQIGIDPTKVSIHGYGGWPLEEDFRKPFYDDLPPVAIWKGDDFLLFYGRGTTKWEYGTDNENKRENRFIHTQNPYAESGCYFLTDSYGTCEEEKIPSAEGAATRITSFDYYLLHELDEVSLNKSGRELYGESFFNPTQTITFPELNAIPGVLDEDGVVEFRFIAKVEKSEDISLSINNNNVISGLIHRPVYNSDYIKATATNLIGTWKGDKAGQHRLKIQFEDQSNPTACLDYIRIQVKRELKNYGPPFLFFRSTASIGNVSRFIIKNATSSSIVFDVTDPVSMKRMESTLNGDELSFTVPADQSLHEFALVQVNNTKFSEIKPGDMKEVKNQNLHGLSPVDMVIITPPAFKTEANRLAKAHMQKDGLDVYVITPEEIYNEFSSGTPDATAYRRFMKMLYDRGLQTGKPLKYLLLFADGAFDNRFISSDWRSSKSLKDNMLLTYQTQESLNQNSHVADDYFGLLDDTDGANIALDKVDIGIGRFPIRTHEQAIQMVDKVIRYMENHTGNWKNKVCFVADDGNSGDKYDVIHQADAERLAKKIEGTRPETIIYKLYFDAYKKSYENGIEGYPTVKAGIKKYLKEGLSLINYVGHGSTESWSENRVLVKNDIIQFNYPVLPLWITATCDFCRFDDITASSGEEVFLNPKSGGIALITTSRVAYTGTNYQINNAVINLIYNKSLKRGETLGDIMCQAKSSMDYSINKVGFCLIGDPALKLYYPENEVQINRVNGVATDGDTILFKALDQITLEGEVIDKDGNTNLGFDGRLSVDVFDNMDYYRTLGNNKVWNDVTKETDTMRIDYEDYKSKLFTGRTSVENGSFKLTFTVPKDISYTARNHGKISMYAYDESNGQEAQGSFLRYKVGTTADNPVIDNEAPEIRTLYLNDTTFISGTTVNPTPYFYAKVWDQTGINVTGSSIGHDISLFIDGNLHNLNACYEASPDAEGEGVVRYSISRLSPGLHEAEFVVWDVLNQSSRQQFTFVVDESIQPSLYEVIASPNPARESVTFRLSHNRPDSRIKVVLHVYDFAGRLEWTHEEQGSSEQFKEYLINWDLHGIHGTRLKPGIYIYRAAIREGKSKETSKAGKLIILAH